MGDRFESRPKLPKKGPPKFGGTQGPYSPGLDRPQPKPKGGFPGTITTVPTPRPRKGE